MAPARLLLSLLGPLLLFSHGVCAHSSDDEHQSDWATQHLADEHHISNFDGGAFFQLHDFDDNGYWDFEEIYTTYGLKHETTDHIASDRKDDVIKQVLSLIDRDQDGRVTKEEWMAFVAGGGKLPDFGMGPGHHGDDEYEYEIHHWEKYHDENTREEDLTHPEDIAHFKKHDEMDAEADRIAKLDSQTIVLDNIPQKFRIAN
ncbi:hypothetical protein V496_07417 [Pseudogymnoascus sp. VKM F-4515 (FW-2607)]|nr:hypothetical protein V496_07417 [Pseudogymnoascus sp. VKM F-4515 (FW-2607)]KFY99266.1 hypothetical protein V498_00879 [Pseudogymnoascus sp. VKM F-4517 (FW-2822)]